MEITDLVLWLIFWVLFIFAQATLINGIFISAKGSSGKMADDTWDHSEMILYPIYRFLNQSTEIRHLYTYANLRQRKSIPQEIINLIDFKNFTPGKGFALREGFTPGSTAVIVNYANVAGVNVKIEDGTVAFYEVGVKYKFSKYIRKPIITCVICMASFWSIFTFLIPAFCMYGFQWIIIPLFVANVFSVAYVNFRIFKARV